MKFSLINAKIHHLETCQSGLMYLFAKEVFGLNRTGGSNPPVSAKIKSMKNQENNYAFIDGQNLHLGVKDLGWKLNYKRFLIYLREKYQASKTYLFIGYVPENQELYKFLQEYGYILIFKPILIPKDGKPKGNVDADLVLHTMIEYPNYNKAIIVTSDGDFYSLVEYLYSNNKLRIVLASHKKKCSVLLQKKAREKIDFMDNLKGKLEYKNRK